MNTHFKDINIGLLIQQKVNELEIEQHRICNFLQCNESEVEAMFLQKDLPTDIVLRWSKLLKFDFLEFIHNILFSILHLLKLSKFNHLNKIKNWKLYLSLEKVYTPLK